MIGKLLGPDIEEMLEERRLREVREALVEMSPHDVAELLADLSQDQCAVVFRILPRALASDVFEELSVDYQKDLLSSLNREQTRHIVEEMAPDDRTAFLEELPASVTRKLLRLLSAEERHIAQTLLAYPEGSVGRLMTPDYIDLSSNITAAEAIDFIRQVGMDRETVYACYVTSPGHVLEGVVGLKTLVLAPAGTLVKDLMSEPETVAFTDDDQERAAHLMRDYDLLALPVLDHDRRLVGIVTVDDVIDVIEEEASEDIQVMAGVLPETDHEFLRQKILDIGWRRGAPLLGQMLAQAVTVFAVFPFFTHRLEKVIALVVFMPLIAALGGSTGVQTAMLIVRALSTGEVAVRDFLRVLWREMVICLLIGAVLGTLAFALACGYVAIDRNHEAPLGLVPAEFGATVGGALVFVMFVSVLAGTTMPILFKALRFDPALTASPFITTTVDLLGLIIYFNLARWILHI